MKYYKVCLNNDRTDLEEQTKYESTSNPYFFESHATNAEKGDPQAQSFVLWLFFFYPVIAKLLFCVPWFLTWIQDGKYPIPMITGPSGVLAYCAWIIGMTAFLTIPVGTPLGVVAAWKLSKRVSPQWRGISATILITIYLSVCYLIYLLVVYDPFTIIEWWQD